ncbi:MAG: SPOR domain-containing protein [Alteromonadaceae bacterium]|nr:SPOR domain-containing protein [Alteromonadaceae bacterium]
MKTQYFTVIGLVLIAMLSGCANQPASHQAPKADSAVPPLTAEERLAIRTLLANYPQHKEAINAWRANQDGVERLLVLEDEFKVLISQLNALAESSESASTGSNKPVQTGSAPIPPKMAQVQKPGSNMAANSVSEDNTDSDTGSDTTETISGQYGVQLAAMGEKQTLVVLWQQLATQAPAIFSAKIPRYQQVMVNGNAIFRLKTGLFATREGADEMCRQIRALQRVCIVTQYDGSEQALTD